MKSLSLSLILIGSYFLTAYIAASFFDTEYEEIGYTQGYTQALIDIASITGETVNKEMITDDYEHFADRKNILLKNGDELSFYIVSKNGVKTIAKHEQQE